MTKEPATGARGGHLTGISGPATPPEPLAAPLGGRRVSEASAAAGERAAAAAAAAACVHKPKANARRRSISAAVPRETKPRTACHDRSSPPSMPRPQLASLRNRAATAGHRAPEMASAQRRDAAENASQGRPVHGGSQAGSASTGHERHLAATCETSRPHGRPYSAALAPALPSRRPRPVECRPVHQTTNI